MFYIFGKTLAFLPVRSCIDKIVQQLSQLKGCDLIDMFNCDSLFVFIIESLRNSCDENNFHCHTGNRCILSSYRCDGDYDCEDSSDELYCGMFYYLHCFF